MLNGRIQQGSGCLPARLLKSLIGFSSQGWSFSRLIDFFSADRFRQVSISVEAPMMKAYGVFG
jgi:hypothetical protein